MEEARCWMLANREANYKCEEYSWEERAFAEDTAGMLGGCVWPPRSYTCNFCRREFRSAQALGGHMNVHRRDRARLKQIPAITHPQNPTFQNQIPSLKSHLSLSDKSNQPLSIIDPSPMFVPRASVVSIHQTIYTPESKFISSFVVNHDPNLTCLCVNNDDDTSKQVPLNGRKQLKRSSSSFTNLSGSTTVVDNNTYKKRKQLDTSATTPVPKNYVDQAPNLDIPNKEEIDLELRLGDRPKVQ